MTHVPSLLILLILPLSLIASCVLFAEVWPDNDGDFYISTYKKYVKHVRAKPPRTSACPQTIQQGLGSNGDVPLDLAFTLCRVREDLSRNLQINENDVTVIEAEYDPFGWTYDSLYCYEPGARYDVADGYRIVLEARGRRYTYRRHCGT